MFMKTILREIKSLFTFKSRWILLIETQASIIPFKTQGKAFKGLMSMLRRAMLVKTVAAVNFFPINTYVPKVKIDINTGVVAQKYTQSASRYFRPFKYLSSDSLISEKYNITSRAIKGQVTFLSCRSNKTLN